MPTSLATAPASVTGARHWRTAGLHGTASLGSRDADDCSIGRQFAEMQRAFRDHGGLARVQDLLARFKPADGANLATLARWIVKREVVCFDWQQQTWFPLFQLEARKLLLKPPLRTVLAELSPVFDHWEIANWFARANPWLANSSPVATFATDMPAVLYAARTERFIANG